MIVKDMQRLIRKLYANENRVEHQTNMKNKKKNGNESERNEEWKIASKAHRCVELSCRVMCAMLKQKLETEAVVIYLVIRWKTALLFTDYEQFPHVTLLHPFFASLSVHCAHRIPTNSY